MKNVLILIFLIFHTISSATDYYISSSGNDINNNGLSSSTPWKTIPKVNSAFSIMKPGDRILFNRGDTFYGTITIAKSGTSGSPIVIGAYGTGNDPIITGFTTITGWTNEGGGIYSKVITSSAKTNVVTIDGVQHGMGRTPDATYLTYESFSTNVSITDNGLGDATDWTGADVVIRKNDWTLDRCSITDHTGDMLTYTNLGTTQDATPHFGYFIQNDLRCVTAYGEWYHDYSGTGKFYMYFGTVDPTTKIVKVATVNTLICNEGYDYITIDNISFVGSISYGISFNANSDYCTIQNCSIDFAGSDGVYVTSNCDHTLIDNNSINHSGRASIYFYNGHSNTATNNTIKNSGVIGGIANAGSWNDGLYMNAQDDGLLQYNDIDSSGKNGIYFVGNRAEVRNNLVNHSLLLLDDGGGIYTSGSTHTDRVIDGNIVLNTLGNNDGTTNTESWGFGIYLDEYSEDIIVTNNTVAGSSYSGILLHKAHVNNIENNTLFNNRYGIQFSNSVLVSEVHDNIVTDNIFFAKATTQYALGIRSLADDIPGFGTAGNNYYTRPVDDDHVFWLYQPSLKGMTYKTLAEWQSYTSQDANSHKSPISITDTAYIDFYYNATKVKKSITLNQPMADVKGTKYANSITLLSYTSVVLMVDPNPAQPVILVTGLSVTVAGGNATITSNGGTLQLSAIVLPANATNKTITWSLANGTGQASIDASGLVTAITNGTATITATAADGSGESGSLIITIINQSVNNNTPVINDQQFTIQESTFTNNLIGTVIANDIDSPQNLNYAIVSGNESGIFAINSLTGELTAIDNAIFGGGTLTFILKVRVTDNADEPLSASANITVNLIGKSTVIYINPDNTNDNLANGSIDHPYDSWDDVSWKEGCTYLQKRGTATSANKILIGANKVTLGAYGEGELPVISSETNTYLISGFEISGIKIKDLNLQAANAVSCIYFLGNSGDSIIIEHCELEENANAIKVVEGLTLITKYNTIKSNHEGIYSTAVSNEIYYNIFKSCNTAINVMSNSSKANIYNNVFYDNEKSLSVSYAELTLYNNIFYMTVPGQMALCQGTGSIESDHNIFYPEQAGFVSIANTQFDNLDELQKSLKIDLNSFNTDPLFVDIYNENFSLEAGSPAINAGVDLQLGIDFEGSIVPLAGGTDIGINEFTGPIIPSKNPNEKSVMTLYPNPSSGQISILAEIKQDMLSDDPGYNQPQIQVMDISGKTVFSKLLENQNSSIIQDDIDLTGISNGLYFVVLHLADKVIKEKLVLTK